MIDFHTGGYLMMIVFIGVALLGAALVYALIQNSRRDRSRDGEAEAATRELYDNPDAPPEGERHRHA